MLAGLANGLVIIDLFNKYLAYPPSPPPQPSPICKISSQDLDVLHLQCQALALSLESLNYEPVVENGNEGVIPALNAYLKESDTRHWKRAVEALAQLLLDAQAVLTSIARITGPRMDWSSAHVPLSNEQIQTVTDALNIVEPALAQFDKNANTARRISRDDVQNLLKQLTFLPEETARALDSIHSLQEARQKASCP